MSCFLSYFLVLPQLREGGFCCVGLKERHCKTCFRVEILAIQVLCKVKCMISITIAGKKKKKHIRSQLHQP